MELTWFRYVNTPFPGTQSPFSTISFPPAFRSRRPAIESSLSRSHGCRGKQSVHRNSNLFSSRQMIPDCSRHSSSPHCDCLRVRRPSAATIASKFILNHCTKSYLPFLNSLHRLHHPRVRRRRRFLPLQRNHGREHARGRRAC